MITPLRPFPSPVPRPDKSIDAFAVRGNDNLLVEAVNGLLDTPNAGLFVGVVATTIYTPTAGNRFGWVLVSGDNGAAGFADLVAFGTLGASGAVVLAGGVLRGVPAARAYAVVGGVLQLTMAAGTYAVAVRPFGLV